VAGEPWQHYYQSQRLRLSYWTWGDGANPPLILIHGGRDHARAWDRIAEGFRDDYHVIACDLRGHGDSEWATGSLYGLPEHALDLVALIDLVGGRATVVGHSFGGAITLLTAGAFPDRFERIVAIEGAGARMDERPSQPLDPDRFKEWASRTRSYEQHTARVYPTIQAARDRMREANRFLSEEMAEHLARWGTNGIDGGYVWKFDPWVRGRSPVEVRGEDMSSFWQRIPCPVLHLVGSESHFKRAEFRAQRLDEYFDDSRTEVVADAGHWLHHDQLDQTVDAMRRFFGAPPVARETDLGG
jgi:pimeloyl-ACP methyl ester carboxylesterase